jgi:FkbM family methyltransferase
VRPTASLILQRIWRASEPSLIGSIRLLPNPIKVVLFRALAETLRVREVTVNGVFGQYRGDPRDLAVITEYMITGTYSPALMKTLLDWFDRRGRGSFLDIGANIGFTTVPLARAGVDCYCFEPDVRNFHWLSANTRDVSDKIKLFNVALFDKDGELDFEVSDWNFGDHRVRVGSGEAGAFGEQHRKVVKIKAQRLDDVLDLATLQRPLAVKIDTQGAEAQILRGGTRIVSSADLLSLEFCPYLVRRMGESEDTLIDFVAAHFKSGMIANWHKQESPGEWLKIDDLVKRLRDFSASANTTQHLDLLLTRD